MTVTRLNQKQYLVRKVVDGRDVRRVAPTRKLADELDAALTARRFRLGVGLPADRQRVVFGEWVETWLKGFATHVKPRTVEVLKERQPHWKALNTMWVDQISRETLEDLCLKLKPHTAHRVCADVRRIIRAAQDYEYAVDESVFRARMAKPRPRQQIALSWAEVENIASECPTHIQRGVLFLALTGLRVSEFCALTDQDVIFDKTGPGTVRGGEAVEVPPSSAPPSGATNAGPAESASADRHGVGGASYILVRKSKTHAGVRRVYLTEYAALLVREQMLARTNSGEWLGPKTVQRGADSRVKAENRPPGPGGGRLDLIPPRILFPTSTGTRYNKNSFGLMLRRATKRLGVEGVHPHTFRSSFVTFCAQAGIPFDVVKAQAGWSDAQAAQMWQGYRKLAGWETPQAMRLLDSFLAEPEAKEAAQ